MVSLFVFFFQAYAQTSTPPSNRAGTPEQRAARAFEKARANPLDYGIFCSECRRAETCTIIWMERYTRNRGFGPLLKTVSAWRSSISFGKPQRMTQSDPPQPVCGDGRVPVAQAFSDQHLYDEIVDAFSMRGFVPAPGARVTTISSTHLRSS